MTILAETAALKSQKPLVTQRDDVQAQQAGWATSQQRLDDLDFWCQLQARNLDTLNYEKRRLALEALRVVARVWSTDHDSRYDITLRLDPLPNGIGANDPRLESDDAPFEAHVGASIRRGYARRGEHRAGRL